jgi:hypothetical protein
MGRPFDIGGGAKLKLVARDKYLYSGGGLEYLIEMTSNGGSGITILVSSLRKFNRPQDAPMLSAMEKHAVEDNLTAYFNSVGRYVVEAIVWTDETSQLAEPDAALTVGVWEAAPIAAPSYLSAIVGCGATPISLIFAAFAVFEVGQLWASRKWLWSVIGIVCACVGLWCLFASLRLVLGRARSDGGLLSNVALRVAAILCLGLPVFTAAAGWWRNPDAPVVLFVFDSVVYLVMARALWQLASSRAAARQEKEPRDRNA